MAILKMTRAEYEAKYGVKAPVASTTPKTTPTTGQGFGARASQAIKKRGENVYEAITGTEEYAGRSPIRRGVEATAEAFSAPVDVAYQALPQVARKGLKAIGKGVGKGFSYVTDKLSDTEAYKQYAAKHPTGSKFEEVLGTGAAAGNIAGNILTINAGAKALDAGAKVVGKVGGKALQGVGTGVKTAGQKLYKSGYNLTADEARLLQGHQSKLKFLQNERGRLPKGSAEYNKLTSQIDDLKANPPKVASQTALEKGIAGTEKKIGVQAGAEKMDVWKNKIEPALKASKDKITKDELFAKAKARVAAEVEPTRKADLQRALESLQDDYKDFTGSDLLQANQIKTALDKFTPSKIFKGQDVASTAKTLKADMADAIREKTYSALKDGSMKSAYRDYANLKQLEKVGIKALTESGTKGGFGSFWSTLKDQATTPVKTIGGKVLYRVGNKLEFLGEKGTRTLGDHLNKMGINIVPRGGGKPPTGGIRATPEGARTAIKSSEAFNVEEAIKRGDVLRSEVYNGKYLQPDFAVGRINDVAQKLDLYKAGLGETYKAIMNVDKTTMSDIVETGLRILDKSIQKGGDVISKAIGTKTAYASEGDTPKDKEGFFESMIGKITNYLLDDPKGKAAKSLMEMQKIAEEVVASERSARFGSDSSQMQEAQSAESNQPYWTPDEEGRVFSVRPMVNLVMNADTQTDPGDVPSVRLGNDQGATWGRWNPADPYWRNVLKKMYEDPQRAKAWYDNMAKAYEKRSTVTPYSSNNLGGNQAYMAVPGGSSGSTIKQQGIPPWEFYQELINTYGGPPQGQAD